MAKSRAMSKAKRSIRQMKSDVFEQVPEAELDELTRVKRWCHVALKIAVMVWQDFFDNLVKLQAMALAFKTLLSLAPLLAVLFSILKAFGVHNRMEPAVTEALAPLGDKGREITAYLIGFVDKMSAGALGAVGLVTLFITVLSLMDTIEEAFNRIWRVRANMSLDPHGKGIILLMRLLPYLNIWGAFT
jgi:membrane protein